MSQEPNDAARDVNDATPTNSPEPTGAATELGGDPPARPADRRPGSGGAGPRRGGLGVVGPVSGRARSDEMTTNEPQGDNKDVIEIVHADGTRQTFRVVSRSSDVVMGDLAEALRARGIDIEEIESAAMAMPDPATLPGYVTGSFPDLERAQAEDVARITREFVARTQSTQGTCPHCGETIILSKG
jgi:hypothetical protein